MPLWWEVLHRPGAKDVGSQEPIGAPVGPRGGRGASCSQLRQCRACCPRRRGRTEGAQKRALPSSLSRVPRGAHQRSGDPTAVEVDRS